MQLWRSKKFKILMKNLNINGIMLIIIYSTTCSYKLFHMMWSYRVEKKTYIWYIFGMFGGLRISYFVSFFKLIATYRN